MAQRLSKIAGVSLEDIGKVLFSSGTAEEKSAEELFNSDYKVFHLSGQTIGVGQITCTDSAAYLARKEELLSVMAGIQKHQELDVIILMLTDVLQEGSWLLYLGSDDIMQQAFNITPVDNQVFLSGVMSRKKQIIPMFTALWG